MKNLFNNKTAKGLVSFVTIIVLLSSILATIFFYENSITANVIREDSANWESSSTAITEVDDINGLNQLNEGWYEVRNGFVFYLDTFNSYVPLYIRIANIEYNDGLLVVDENGNVEFSYRINGINENVVTDEEDSTQNLITGQVTEPIIDEPIIGGGIGRGEQLVVNPDGTATGLSTKSTYVKVGNEWKVKASEAINVPQQGQILSYESPALKQAFWSLGYGYYDDASKSIIIDKTDVVSFQQKYGLTQDGLVGPLTGSKINDALELERKQQSPATVSAPSAPAAPTPAITSSTPAPAPESAPPKPPTLYQNDERLFYMFPGDTVTFVLDEKEYKATLQKDGSFKDQDGDLYGKEEILSWLDAGFAKDYISVIGQAPAPVPTAPSPTSSVLPSPGVGQTIQLNIIDLTKKKPEEIGKPGAQGLPSTAEGPQKVEQHAVKISDTDYQIVTVYKDGDKQSVAINKATPEIKDGKITGFQIGEVVSTQTINPALVQDADIKQWTGKLDNIPIANGVRDASKCTFNLPTCTYTDSFKDQSKSTTTITPTEKTTEKFKTAYYLNEKELSNEEYSKLKTEEKNKVIIVQNSPTLKLVEVTKDEKIYSTRYEYNTIFVDNKPIRVYEATTIDIQNGKMIMFAYGDPQKGEVVFENPNGINVLDVLSLQKLITSSSTADEKSRAEAATRLQQAISRQFFSDVQRVLTEFQGLSYLPTLFMDQDSLLAWRDNVDRVFATLYLGTEYWSSSICGTYLDGESEGIAYAETPQGLLQVGAHIEATRSEPLITPTGVEFLYKITFNVRNGDYENDRRAPEQMNVNVFLRGERTATVFKQDQTVKRGSSFGKIGRNAIVKYSTTLYTEVCLTFDQIPLRWKLDNGELCNTIVTAGGAATPVASSGASAPSAGSSGTGEFNDF
ncbi:hypothetical protein J4234_01345 [Candidatus Woesearchaeota archaeon]|nr:hypothetical protein [Candidatus Woesearchaeota archaeon]